MKTNGDTEPRLNQSGHNLLRILIASYFIAVALGLISGTGGDVFAAQVLAEPYATQTGQSLVFVLGFLVLTGYLLRPAALLLAVVVFWSSYFTNFGPAGPVAVSEFWRDMALIGALMMTYVHSTPRSLRRAAMIRFTPRVRKIKTNGEAVAPRRIEAQTNIRDRVRPLKPVAEFKAAPRHGEGTQASASKDGNIFADDYEVAAVS